MHSFNGNNLNTIDAVTAFKKDGVILLKNLFDATLCEEAAQYIIKNECQLTRDWSFDKKRMVTEFSESLNKVQVKYFELPHTINRSLFGRFVDSKVMKMASMLLNSDVFLFSMEFHSRLPGGSNIPVHQDNAYYGLQEAKALTIYVSLTPQSFQNGGLRYLSSSLSTSVHEHVPSNSPAFSLTLSENSKAKISGNKNLDPIYEVGDATIHHSTSLHYADEVPNTSDRGLVIRLTYMSIEDCQIPAHEEWYSAMIAKNRK